MNGRNLRGGGIKQKGKRTTAHGQQCGDCRGEGGKRGLNGNGKNTKKKKKIKSKKKNNNNLQMKTGSGNETFLKCRHIVFYSSKDF